MELGSIFWISVIVIFIVGLKVGHWKLFEKAGQPGWAALVPIYNWYIWLKLIGKPVWWIAILLIPAIGVLAWVSMTIDLVRSFGKYKLGEHAASLFLFPYYLPKIGFDPEVKYLGPPETHKNVPAKGQVREWGDAILFAGVSALIIRTFFIEAFMIPTSSMERTLMAGDFLFVSKYHYGARMPMVPASIPFIHNKIKLGNFVAPSYTDLIKLPYWRLPGLSSVERNDIVVFNYPAHDVDDLGDGAGKIEAISMKENYIKRCVAVPGDTLSIRNQQVYVNGEVGYNPPLMQYQYLVETDGTGFSQSKLNELGFRTYDKNVPNENPNYGPTRVRGQYAFFMPDSVAELIRAMGNVKKVDTVYSVRDDHDSRVYPTRGNTHKWNIDNYGPIYIPKAGSTIPLNTRNLALYWRIIEVYEGHSIEVGDNKILIDGEQVTEYTFEMNYYWMMGDNRHNSQDSRIWGFVPENHIVGKPLFVFFSYEDDFGVRWNRIGTKYTH